jgi:carbon storage regulator
VSVDVGEAQHSLDTKGLVMLVLSRKPGERILIGDNVAVTIVRIGPNSVRLGIDAPRDMNIVREELCMPSNANGVATAPPAEATAVAHGM